MNIFVEDGAKLGLMIRGGSEYGLGIYIAGVDPHGMAEEAGLKVSLIADYRHLTTATQIPGTCSQMTPSCKSPFIIPIYIYVSTVACCWPYTHLHVGLWSKSKSN